MLFLAPYACFAFAKFRTVWPLFFFFGPQASGRSRFIIAGTAQRTLKDTLSQVLGQMFCHSPVQNPLKIHGGNCPCICDLSSIARISCFFATLFDVKHKKISIFCPVIQLIFNFYSKNEQTACPNNSLQFRWTYPKFTDKEISLRLLGKERVFMSSSVLVRLTPFFLIAFLYAIPLYLIAHWGHRLWRRTGDSAFLWMRYALGIVPILLTVITVAIPFGMTGSNAVSNVIRALYPSIIPGTLGFIKIILVIVMLSKLGQGCVGFRELFQIRIPNQIPSDGLTSNDEGGLSS